MQKKRTPLNNTIAAFKASLTTALICTTSFSIYPAEDFNANEYWKKKIDNIGISYFKEAEKETNVQCPDMEILIKCAVLEEAALKASGNSSKNKAFFDYFRAPGIWEDVFEAFKPVIKKYPQCKRYRLQLFKFAVYADRVNELWSWLRKEEL
jgi:hypothetical protein